MHIRLYHCEYCNKPVYRAIFLNKKEEFIGKNAKHKAMLWLTSEMRKFDENYKSVIMLG